jgi:predicted DNA-binding antitoxin AbrB/MazE fold protein
MYSINAVYDGTGFKPKEPIPVNEEYEVVITFTVPVKKPVTIPRSFSKSEKEEITNSLFGVLPADVDLDEARTERLSK